MDVLSRAVARVALYKALHRASIAVVDDPLSDGFDERDRVRQVETFQRLARRYLDEVIKVSENGTTRHSLSMMVVGAMAIFTVKFWSVLWYLAMWVEQNLILSMYPDVNVFLQIFANPGEHDAKRLLLNMITTSLYLGLPLLWSGMMAWAGISVGRAINNATAPLARPADDAGRQGGAIGKAAVSKGLRRQSSSYQP